MKELIEKQRELINFLDDLSDILTKEQWLERKILFDEVAALESQLSGKEWYEKDFVEWLGEMSDHIFWNTHQNIWNWHQFTNDNMNTSQYHTSELYQYWQSIKEV